MPVGRNRAFLCLSFASHEGRRRVRVKGHILALTCRGQADEALILYCQAVLLTFLNHLIYIWHCHIQFVVVLFLWLLLLLLISLQWTLALCLVLIASRCLLHFCRLLISCTFLYLILEAGEMLLHTCTAPPFVVFPWLEPHLSKDLPCSWLLLISKQTNTTWTFLFF